ncbi:hypothetical protein COY25_01470 [Candidatus Uhrbacteria bacterium CG_4_10_14_0_2_um_filter_41_7]|uniref:Uncharacterized protein n=1 Tax=Candidatus Uhrbacteria bacterium CG_4_9_14_3_um_filter_41_35 TaxID=1975034 RepID=A0A2M7XEL8_9BACT|nr:MAG: hypothetical protein COV92_00725 [Candidatus Uhrbacteria bacterium CG11_big_fil_rev_8_21_14_0_20_41_9]PIZ54955.1 MAG: hypothetical protein COY25_01470 [Candidatus Uhrbacteria bacterium CG_4_10_14_0_2_um_filter_41_7]PJA46327.1 MAG: hypothetical protein CO173_03130 [Candidatus Uhrbacteria bacterium CG_4_9_14_3_um_filter_41_35]
MSKEKIIIHKQNGEVDRRLLVSGVALAVVTLISTAFVSGVYFAKEQLDKDFRSNQVLAPVTLENTLDTSLDINEVVIVDQKVNVSVEVVK